VQTAIENNHLSIWVKDDGQGIPPHAATNLGHGLRNMEKRTTQLGGTFAITHSEGTIIHLRFPVSALQD
jgi:signal transduction histidine kinase